MAARPAQHPLLRALAATRLLPTYRGELPPPPDAEQMSRYRRVLHVSYGSMVLFAVATWLAFAPRADAETLFQLRESPPWIWSGFAAVTVGPALGAMLYLLLAARWCTRETIEFCERTLPPFASELDSYRMSFVLVPLLLVVGLLPPLLMANVGVRGTADSLVQQDWFEFGETRYAWAELSDFQRTTEVRRGESDWMPGTDLVWVFAAKQRVRHRITSWHPAEALWLAISATESRSGVACRPVKREE